jgi:SAM-dependent methyltransferase
MNSDDLIKYNIVSHDRVAVVRGQKSYDSRHVEIFNRCEQRRLQKALKKAWRLRQTDNTLALDFGCGTGNLTEKIVHLNARVVAADVSSGMLKLIEEKLPDAIQSGQLLTHLLTGNFPLPFPDGHFGFVATYSVLHHIPDYLAAVRELARVVDKGGVLYIDHEAVEDVYQSPQPLGLRIHRNLHIPAFGIPERIKRLLKKRSAATDQNHSKLGTRGIPDEGDIHIYSDDHIEWGRILNVLRDCGFLETSCQSYLACTETSLFPWRYGICRPFVVNTGSVVGIKM